MREDDLFRAHGLDPQSPPGETQEVVHTVDKPVDNPSTTTWMRAAKVPYNWRTHVRLSTMPSTPTADLPTTAVPVANTDPPAYPPLEPHAVHSIHTMMTGMNTSQERTTNEEERRQGVRR